MEPVSMPVGLTSTIVAPSRTIPQDGATLWVTATAVLQGAYRSNSNGDLYFAVDAGTTGANEPVHLTGDVSDGTVTWRRIPRGKRQGLVIVNDSDTEIYTAVGYDDAILNGGKRLNKLGGSSSAVGDGVHQLEVRAISSIAGKILAIEEW